MLFVKMLLKLTQGGGLTTRIFWERSKNGRKFEKNSRPNCGDHRKKKRRGTVEDT